MSSLPFDIVSDIVRRVGKGGFRDLGPFIAAGPELKSIVYSSEVLAEVDIDEYIFVPQLGAPDSPYRPFLDRCRLAGHHIAQYVTGLRILSTTGPDQLGISMLLNATPHLLYARFACAAFLCLCGNKDVGKPVFDSFLQLVPDIEEASYIGYQVCDQIAAMSTPGRQLFRGRFSWGTPADIPYCQMNHPTLRIVCKHCFALSFCWHIADMC